MPSASFCKEELLKFAEETPGFTHILSQDGFILWYYMDTHVLHALCGQLMTTSHQLKFETAQKPMEGRM
jgi:hypothetical protein